MERASRITPINPSLPLLPIPEPKTARVPKKAWETPPKAPPRSLAGRTVSTVEPARDPIPGTRFILPGEIASPTDVKPSFSDG